MQLKFKSVFLLVYDISFTILKSICLRKKYETLVFLFFFTKSLSKHLPPAYVGNFTLSLVISSLNRCIFDQV